MANYANPFHEPEVFGPYSAWPRQDAPKRWKNPTIAIGSVVGAAVFVHCAVPMLF